MAKNKIQIWDGSILEIIGFEPIAMYSKDASMVNTTFLQGGEEFTIPMILYENASLPLFCPKDWQGIQGKTPEEILEYNNWIELQTGQDAIMYNGLPLLPPFSPPMGRPRKNPVTLDDQGRETVEVITRQQGNTGAALIPKSWIGSRVLVIKLD